MTERFERPTLPFIKSVSRRGFLNLGGRLAAGAALYPAVGSETKPSIDYPFPHGYLFPQHITIEPIELSESIAQSALTGAKWEAPNTGLASPIDYPYAGYKHIEKLWNTTYIFGHSNFRGVDQVAKNFEDIKPGHQIVLNESVDKLTGEKVPNLTYIVREDGFLVADLKKIMQILHRDNEQTPDWSPRLILQTTFRTNGKNGVKLLDAEVLGRSRIETSDSFQNQELYWCFLVIADLAK